jgi:hypothetical protein
MRGDQVVARCSPPVALAARDQYDLAAFSRMGSNWDRCGVHYVEPRGSSFDGTAGGATTGITPGRQKAEAELASLYRERADRSEARFALSSIAKPGAIAPTLPGRDVSSR